MMDFGWIRERLSEGGSRPLFISDQETWTYEDVVQGWSSCDALLVEQGIGRGHVVAIEGDHVARVVCLMLALMGRGCVMVPLGVGGLRGDYLNMARVNFTIRVSPAGYVVSVCGEVAGHDLLRDLRACRESGLILFSSGSTGEPKASLLSMNRLLERYRDTAQKAMRSLVFLSLDHIGGINTVFAVMLVGGSLVSLQSRSVADVCGAIERHQVTVLPTTPTFLNMMLLADMVESHDLSCLELITYGTEPMPQATLLGLRAVLPDVRLKQTYGLTELGIVATQSRDDGTTWFRIGGDCEVDIREGLLWLRTKTAMLGYLNHAAAFDEMGWFNTGDRVEVKGDQVRVLGRESEIINVGGEKVFPAEVEAVILAMPEVVDVRVYGKKSPITGEIVVAEVQVPHAMPAGEFAKSVRAWCGGSLERYKVPVLVLQRLEDMVSPRMKKRRHVEGGP